MKQYKKKIIILLDTELWKVKTVLAKKIFYYEVYWYNFLANRIDN